MSSLRTDYIARRVSTIFMAQPNGELSWSNQVRFSWSYSAVINNQSNVTIQVFARHLKFIDMFGAVEEMFLEVSDNAKVLIATGQSYIDEGTFETKCDSSVLLIKYLVFTNKYGIIELPFQSFALDVKSVRTFN